MKKIQICIYCFSFLFLTFGVKAQNKVEYDLYVNDTIVNYTGKARKAIAINGQIPAPSLYFTEGDTAVIRVHNLSGHPTSIHWHGILLPQPQDGVPYLTSAPIAPHTTHIYHFPIIQNGTYWYHSHFGLQEQKGLYGAFIIRKGKDHSAIPHRNTLPDYPVVLSDWTNRKAKEVNRMLHIGSDWFSIRKGSVQSYGEALRKGQFKTKFLNEWKRMKAMDVSDVYYNCFLLNGRQTSELYPLKAGDTVRLRIINGAASTYFWLQYAGGKITVVANDGKEVEPVEVDRMMIAVSETYDILLTVPDSSTSCELRATSEDREGSASLWLGKGNKKTVAPLPKLNYFAGMNMMNKMMKMDGNMKKGNMKMELQRMDMNQVMYPELTSPTMSGKKSSQDTNTTSSMHTRHGMGNRNIKTLNYSLLKSPVSTNLPSGRPFKEIYLELTGKMDRYVWSLNNKTLSEADLIPLTEGENVRLVLYNNTMMRHPMHLHGHFFRLKNGQGVYAPLKFTVDLLPMETDTIEFNANEKTRGNWYFHCHILYHMMSGMGRVFRYEDSPPNPQLPDTTKAWRRVYHPDRKFYFTIQNNFATNGNEGQTELSNTRWSLQGEWQTGYNDRHGYETEIRLGRYLGKMQWLYPYLGLEWSYRKGEKGEKNLFGQKRKHDRSLAGTAGIRYTLPLLFIAGAQIDTYGHFRLQLERDDIPLTSRLRLNVMGNTDREYSFGLAYILLPYLRVAAGYDNDLKWGAGITLNY